MTFYECFGCTLIAFGPALSMFILTIATDPIRIIILISSAFFWLCALLTSSITWTLLSYTCNSLALSVGISVIFQEMFRYLFYVMIKYAESGLKRVAEVGGKGYVASPRLVLSYVSGLGFGIISGSFAIVNVLADSVGPGTVGLKGDTPYFFLISAVLASAFVLLNVFWSIIFFKGIEIKNYSVIAYVVISHLVASLMTMVNQYQYYWLSIASTYVILIGTGILAFYSAGGTYFTLKMAFSR